MNQGRLLGEHFPFSVKNLSLVARGIANHILEINERFVYANIKDVDYFLQMFRDDKTHQEVLILNSRSIANIEELDGKSRNLIMICHEQSNSSATIKGNILYKAENSDIEFFHTNLGIFLQELERMTVTHILRLGAGASFLGNSIHLLKGCRY
jgi:hypothetical protein